MHSSKECLRIRYEDSVEEQLSKGVATPSLSYGNNRLVGHGVITNQYCGQYFKMKGCLNVENHRNGLMGDFRGKIFRRIIHHDCGKPSCPICYPIWGRRATSKIERRLREASQQTDIPIEHVIVSFPVSMYQLSLNTLRERAEKALVMCGVQGGSLITHAFRYNPVKGWYLSFHLHCLGLLNGYRRCRGCSHNPERLDNYWDDFCFKCDGFEAVVRRIYGQTGLIVKVGDALHERWSIRDTAKYELGHASYDVTKKRSNVVSWFGLCSYRKLKIKPEVKKKSGCPLCQEELVDIMYTGSKKLVTDVGSPDFVRDSFEDAYEDGVFVWAEIVEDG